MSKRYIRNINEDEKFKDLEKNEMNLKAIEEDIEKQIKIKEKAGKYNDSDVQNEFKKVLSVNKSLNDKFINIQIKKKLEIQSKKIDNKIEFKEQKIQGQILERFPTLENNIYFHYIKNKRFLDEKLIDNINNYPVYRLHDGSIYQGNFLNSKKNGVGRVLYKIEDNKKKNESNSTPSYQGSIKYHYYEGFFQDNKIDEFGLIIKDKNQYYIGQIKNGKANGYGILYKKSIDNLKLKMTYYDGIFTDNKYDNSTIVKTKENTNIDFTSILIEYNCEFVKDGKARNYKLYKDLRSRKILPLDYYEKFNLYDKDSLIYNKTEYKGIFKNGEKNDNNALIKTNNFEYRGSIKNDKFNGKGNLKMIDKGISYEGGFRNNQFNGLGKITYSNQRVNSSNVEFDGEFRDHKPHCKNGVFTLSNGSKLSGNWVNGNLNGKILFDLDKDFKGYITFSNGRPVRPNNK